MDDTRKDDLAAAVADIADATAASMANDPNSGPVPPILGQNGDGPNLAPHRVGETGFGWRWTIQAKQAFMNALFTSKNRVKPSDAMNAAMLVDGPAIFLEQVEQLIHHLVTHPQLGDRVLILRPQGDGLVRLKVDEDLLRFVLFDALPMEAARSIMQGDDVEGETTDKYPPEEEPEAVYPSPDAAVVEGADVPTEEEEDTTAPPVEEPTSPPTLTLLK